MVAKSLVLHPAALAESKAAVAWYLERSQTAASGFAASLAKALDRIVESPLRWPTAELGTRRFVMQRYPFAIMYREQGEALQILAVAHGHRRPGYWKNRV